MLDCPLVPRPRPHRTMAHHDDYTHFQVLGANLRNIIAGFGSFGVLGSQIMIEEKLGTAGPNGMIQVEPEQWYPLVGNLRSLERIQKEFGELVVRQTAAAVPKNAPFPPTVFDIHTALNSVDVAYHMNHAVNGQPMFSPDTGEMREGIGHYTCRSVEGRKQFLCECSAPYPCAFDQGLLLAMAQRFEPSASLAHLEPAHCRNRGGASCTYSIP